MISLGLSKNTLKNYEYNGFRPIRNFFADENQERFSAQLAKQYVFQARKQYECGAITHERFRAIRKIETMLEECNKKGTIEWRHIPQLSCRQLGQYFADILLEYICEKEGVYSRNTINDYKSIISQFLDFLEQKGHRNFSDISVKEISGFIPHIADRCPSSMNGVMTALRSFVAFLNDKRFTNIDMLSVLQVTPAKRRKVFPGFSHNEAEAILAAVNRGTATSKRDYAMLLLAKNTGFLRTSPTGL